MSLITSKQAIPVEVTGRSTIWSNFSKINYQDAEISGFVMCKTCENVLSFSNKGGTSHLHRHIASCSDKKTMAIENFCKNSDKFLSSASK